MPIPERYVDCIAADCHWWDEADESETGYWSHRPVCDCGARAGTHSTYHPHGAHFNCRGYTLPTTEPNNEGNNQMTISPAHVAHTADTLTEALTIRQAAMRAQFYPEPRIIQRRYPNSSVESRPDTIELTGYRLEDGSSNGSSIDQLTGYWLNGPGSERAGERSVGFTMTSRDLDSLGDGWHVINPVQPEPEPEPEPEPTRLLPRTVGEAQDMMTALQAMLAHLPGGYSEQVGADAADERELCSVYEQVVTRVFGWAPRPENSGADYRARWNRELDQLEETHQGSYLSLLRTAAQRYERGGVVNQAVVDAMRTHLERHKVPAVNEVLDACGFDGLGHQEYEVTVRVSRQRRVRESGYVTVTVTAEDQDAAAELAMELADPTDGTGWDEDYYYSEDHDDYELDEVTEVEAL